MAPSAINTLFLDIGGVLLTNGWDTDLRKQTAQHFGLDYEEIYHRHHVTYDIYEEGKMTLDEYLWQIVFYEPRPFTPEDFKTYLLEQAKPNQDTIDLVRRLKAVYGLRVAVVSNEGREIAEVGFAALISRNSSTSSSSLPSSTSANRTSTSIAWPWMSPT